MANTLRFKRGLASGIPTALAGEPLFTTDTFDLYIGNGTTNTRFQKYIASGTTSQLLRGDGSLLTMPIVLTSPANGQVLKFNGTSWVNDSDAGITGSGSAGQVAYFTGATTQAGSNNLFWDTTNLRLGVGLNNPSERLHVNGRILNQSGFILNRGDNLGVFTGASDDLGIYHDGTNSIISNSTGALIFSNPSERARIFATGNFGIGTGATDSGQKLQVIGDTLLKGSGNTSATTALTVQNSDGANMFRVRSDNNIFVGSQSGAISLGNTLGTNAVDGGILYFASPSNYDNTGKAGIGVAIASRTTSGSTAVNSQIFQIGEIGAGYAPTSGSLTRTYLQINATINQTGGANGITRGLYVNPTLTAAADWRSIEWSNNSGWGLYGNGTANNYMAGSLGIGGTNLNARSLLIGRTVTGATTGYGILQSTTYASDVTASGINNYSIVATAAATYTLTNAYNYFVADASKGAGSTITNQFGYYSANLTQGTNNFAFYGDIAAATGRWNLYMNGTADNYLAGRLGIGTTPTYTLDILAATGTEPISSPLDNYAARIRRTYTNNNASTSFRRYGVWNEITYTGNQAYTNATGQYNYINYQNTNASSIIGASSSLIEPNATAAATTLYGNQSIISLAGTITNATLYRSFNVAVSAGTITNVRHFQAESTGTTTTITNQYGFIAESTLTGATNNFAFYGNIASGTNRWNFYANGTASNYFNGNTLIGSTTDSGEKLQVTGTMKVTGATALFTTTITSTTNVEWTNSLLVSGGANGDNSGTRAYFRPSGSFGAAIYGGRWSSTDRGARLVGISSGSVENTYIHLNGESSILQLATAATVRATIDASGNLGLGVTPNYKLHVFNAGNVTSAIESSGAGTSSSLRFISPSNYWLATNDGTSAHLTFNRGGTDLIRFSNLGNLMIQNGGTFTDSGERLQVTGTAKITGATNITNTMTARQVIVDGANNSNISRINLTRTDASWGIYNETDFRIYYGSGNTTTPATQYFSLGSGTGLATFSNAVTIGGNLTVDTNTLFVDATNNRVGVLTTTPSTTLDVGGNATIGLTSTTGYSLVVQNSGATDATGIRLTSGGTDNGYFITAYNSVSKYASLQAGDNTAYRSIILNALGGNVGIGMNPSYKLDVTGSARISDAIAIGTTPDTNNPFKILKNLNTTVGIKFENTNTSSLSFSAVQLGNDITGGTAFTNLVYGSSGITESGVYKPSGTALINTGSGGLNFLAVSQPIRFFTSTGNGTERVRIKNEGHVRFVPLSAAPTTNVEAGDVYYDSTTNKLRCYNGTTWNDLF